MLASGVCKGSSLTGETPSHSVPVAFGRFQVLHQIGAGVLGPVFLARDPDRGRSVAIKVFRLDITPEQAAELAAQLGALARANLAHPSIVAPFEAGVEGTVAYLAEDFVGADSLDAAIRQYGPPPTAQGIRILAAVAGALDFAAAVGVHHGALHPRDLLVTPDDTRVTGLGIGRALEAIGLRAPMRRPYVAPERVQREGWDARADIHSLGVLARELLLGRGRNEAGEARLPDEQVERLQSVLGRATAARPADRFPTSLELIGAVQEAVAARATAGPRADAVPPLSSRRRTHDLLLPLDQDAAAAPDDQASIGAEAMALDAAADLPRLAPPDAEPAAAAPVRPLADLDLQHDAPDGRPADGFDLSDLDGHLAAERTPADDETSGQEPPIGEPTPSTGLSERPRRRRGIRFSDEVLGIAAEQPAAEAAAAAFAEPAIEHETEPDRFSDFESPVPPAASPAPASSAPAMAVSETRSDRSRSRGVLMVAMLLVGILIGAFAGYMMGAGARSRTPVPADASASASTSPASSARTSPAEGEMPSAPSVHPAAPPATTVATSTSSPARSAATPPPPANPAVAVKTILVIRSTPRGATVTINGRRRGVTPLRLRDLQPGRYTVRLNRPGFDPEEREVVLSAERPSSTMAFSLDRAVSAQPASRTADFVGSLSVESLPSGARVFVDGRLIGTTPVNAARVSAGSHVVRVDRTGFLPWTSPVQIVTGQRHRVTASLEREAK